MSEDFGKMSFPIPYSIDFNHRPQTIDDNDDIESQMNGKMEKRMNNGNDEGDVDDVVEVEEEDYWVQLISQSIHPTHENDQIGNENDEDINNDDIDDERISKPSSLQIPPLTISSNGWCLITPFLTSFILDFD